MAADDETRRPDPAGAAARSMTQLAQQMREMASFIIPLGRPATPEEAAGPVFFLCSPWADYVHGQVLNVTGGQFGGMYT